MILCDRCKKHVNTTANRCIVYLQRDGLCNKYTDGIRNMGDLCTSCSNELKDRLKKVTDDFKTYQSSGH